MTGNEWDDLAAWYDERQGDDGDLWHRTLIDPTLLAVVGSVSGTALLDFACGNGYLSRRFARGGARVTGVDQSSELLSRAWAREARDPLGIRYRLSDGARLNGLADGAFDLVVSNMAIMDIADADSAIRETARVLRPGGRFVASLSHPCFDVGTESSWLEEHADGRPALVSRKVSRYREAFEYECPWRMASGELHTTKSYHRPLSWYVRVLRASGLALTAWEEPGPTPEFRTLSPDAGYIDRIPLHAVWEAVKIVGGRPEATESPPRPGTLPTQSAPLPTATTIADAYPTPKSGPRTSIRGRERQSSSPNPIDHREL